MPWLETAPMHQRTQFIADYQRDVASVAELCTRFGVSRKTGYKWIERYATHGPAGLTDRSRRPHDCSHHTPELIVTALLDARPHHPTWGAKKLPRILAKRYPTWHLPARSTASDLLQRHGLVTHRRRRRFPSHPGRPLTPMTAPNEIWTADFKGQFLTRNGLYCYPLTIVDGFSRYLLACQGLLSTRIALARPVFHRLFAEYGLPRIIRTDNGVPFATTALGRLSCPRGVRQHAAHHPGGRRIEVGAVLPAYVLPVHQPQKCLIHQGSGLQQMARALLCHVALSKPVQLRVD